MEQNLRKARGKWGQLSKILVIEGADRIMPGRFYVAVVQAVLLFGYETWVLTPVWRNPSMVSTNRWYSGWRS